MNREAFDWKCVLFIERIQRAIGSRKIRGKKDSGYVRRSRVRGGRVTKSVRSAKATLKVSARASIRYCFAAFSSQSHYYPVSFRLRARSERTGKMANDSAYSQLSPELSTLATFARPVKFTFRAASGIDWPVKEAREASAAASAEFRREKYVKLMQKLPDCLKQRRGQRSRRWCVGECHRNRGAIFFVFIFPATGTYNTQMCTKDYINRTLHTHLFRRRKKGMQRTRERRKKNRPLIQTQTRRCECNSAEWERSGKTLEHSRHNFFFVILIRSTKKGRKTHRERFLMWYIKGPEWEEQILDARKTSF